MGGDVRTMKGAWEIWDQIASGDRVGFLTEPDDLEPRLRKHSRLATASPKVWADAYLLAFAQAAGLTLVTFDRFSVADSEWRVAFAFDPRRKAILLWRETSQAAVKSGSTAS